MTARLTEATCALRVLAPLCYDGVNLNNRRPSMYNHTEYSRLWRETNRERDRKNKRDWKAKNRDRVHASCAKYEQTHRLERRCHHKIKRLVAKSAIVRPGQCSRCGKRGRVLAHHPDYTKSRTVEWVCNLCHAEIHFPGCRAAQS